MSDRVPECAACDQDLCVLHDTRSKLDLLGDMARLQGVVDQLRGDKIGLLEELSTLVRANDEERGVYRARLSVLTQRVMALEDAASAVQARGDYQAHLESNRSVT